MERIEKTVFLSYRRTNFSWALNIFQNLTQNGFDVFFDFNGIASGDFERIILGNIAARAHFLVLLTPSALERCNDPVDWLRREIETALANQRNIVPLMLEGFDFGTPKIATQLTGKLAALKHYNGLSIPPEYFSEAMERLRGRYLNVPLASVLHPASPFAQQAAAEQRQAAGSAPAVHERELTAQQWFERGFAAVDIDEQLRFYSEAIRFKPDYADAFINRGSARRAKGDIEGTLQDYSEAIRLKPDYADAFINRGIVRRGKGDIEGALQDCNQAIRLGYKPSHKGKCCIIARIRINKGFSTLQESGRFRGITPLSWPALEDGNPLQMRPRTNSGHSLSRFSVPLLPRPLYRLTGIAAACPKSPEPGRKLSSALPCGLFRQLRQDPLQNRVRTGPLVGMQPPDRQLHHFLQCLNPLSAIGASGENRRHASRGCDQKGLPCRMAAHQPPRTLRVLETA